jgi:hypothetical protein
MLTTVHLCRQLICCDWEESMGRQPLSDEERKQIRDLVRFLGTIIFMVLVAILVVTLLDLAL